MNIVEHTQEILHSYARIPHQISVTSVYDVIPLSDGKIGFKIQERPIDQPYQYHYDDQEHPATWLKHSWDFSSWGFYVAYETDEMVGGAIVAYNTEEVYMLQGRRDITCLWDIRVHPDYQGQGIGSALFEKVKAFSRARKCTSIKIETQNTNVNANKFYQAQGCVLGGINRFAYSSDSEEVQLLWWYLL